MYRGWRPPYWPFVLNQGHWFADDMVHLGVHNGTEWINVVDDKAWVGPITVGTQRSGTLTQTPHGTGHEFSDDDEFGIRWFSTDAYNIPGAISFGGYQSSAALLGNDGGIITTSQAGYFGVSTNKVYELGVLDRKLYGQLSDNSATHQPFIPNADTDLVLGADVFAGAMFSWDGGNPGTSALRAGATDQTQSQTDITATAPADQYCQQWGGETPSTPGLNNYEWVGKGLFGFIKAAYMPLDERDWFASDEVLAYEWLEPYGRRSYFFLFPTDSEPPIEEGDITDAFPTWDGIHLRASTGGGEACTPCSSNRELGSLINSLIGGGSNAVGEIELDAASGTGTRVLDARVGPDTVIIFMPTSSAAAAELHGGEMYVDERTSGSFTILHSAATTSRTFGYGLYGTGRMH